MTSKQHDPRNLAGKTISNYLVLDWIANGAYGDVYRARDVTLNREVALKFISLTEADNQWMIERFDIEAKLVASLEHLHIVPLYAYGHAPEHNTSYLVMRLMRGGTLADLIKRGPTTLTIAIRLIGEIADALMAAHGKHIVHRDLKPSNILLDENDTAYLSDFGIAKNLQSGRTTTDGVFHGTPAYAAPEQVLGEGLTPKADIYALGIILYELLCGQHPFPLGDRYILAMRQLNMSLPRIRILRPDLPPDVDRIIARATHKEPMARYKTAREMADALAKVMQPDAPAPALPNDIDEGKTGKLEAPVEEVAGPTTRPLDESYFFIIHADEDDTLAQQMMTRLGSAGITAWVDHLKAPPGPPRVLAVHHALNNCAGGILLLTPHTAQSTNCASQWGSILDMGKPLHIALGEAVDTDAIDDRLKGVALVNLEERFDAGMATLVRNLESKQAAGSQRALLVTATDGLPLRVDRLIGREEIVERIEKLVADNGRILLQGFAGIGKTTLAAEIVVRAARNTRRAVWIKMGSLDGDQVLEGLSYPLEAHQEIVKLTGDARLQAIGKHLTEHNINLVVLDDVWNGQALFHVLQAIPPEIAVLVTSRQRYPLQHMIEVSSLLLEQALELLALQAGRELTQKTEAAALCRQLTLLPFAIVVAGRVLKSRNWSPGRLLENIKDAPHTLRGPLGFAEDGRAGVADLIEVSLNALEDETRQTFVALGALFAPRTTVNLLRRVLDKPEAKVREALDRLQDHGLVEWQQDEDSAPYYRLHDLAFSFARANNTIERDVIANACRNFVLEHKDDYELLDAEQTNIVRAIEQAQQRGNHDVVIEMMRALTVDGNYFPARGYTPTALEMLKKAVELAKANERLEDAHYLVGKLSDYYREYLGQLDEAVTYYHQATDLARKMGNAHREAWMLALIGTTRFEQGFDDAEDYFQRAFTLADKEDDNHARAYIQHARSYVAMNPDKPDWHSGRRYSQEATHYAEAATDPNFACHCLINQGGCEYELELYAEALQTHTRALHLAKEIEDLYLHAFVMQSLGEDYHGLQDRTNALKHFREALEIWTRIGAKANATFLFRYLEERGYSVDQVSNT